MIIFSLMLIAVAVAGILLFSGNMLLMILAAVAGICGIVLPLIRRDLGKILAGVCICVGLILLVLSGTSTSKNGIQAYAKEVDMIQNRIEKGKLDDAKEKIGELEEAYGVNDTSRLLLAACYEQAKEYDSAINLLEQCSSRGETWYHLMILCWIAKNNGDDDRLKRVVFEAAEAVPENAAFQKLAGAAAMDGGNYKQAVHYYSLAYFLDDTDGESAVQMGLAYHELGEMEMATRFLELALNKEIPEETRSDIEEILTEMGGGK